jgi:membrane protein
MREFLGTWVEAFNEHRLLTFATAIAMRAFIGFIALTFLGIALLGALGEQGIWKKHIATAIQPKLTHPTYEAINSAVEKVFTSNSTGLIAFAAAYAVWQMSGSIRAVMDALNAIIECDEKRPTYERFLISIALAVAVMVLIACALFVVFVSGKLLGESGGGVLHWLIGVLRWPVGAIFLGLAVGLVARFAPMEHRGRRWASVGATLIVVAWLVQSAIYAWFLENVANYKSAAGNLLLLVVVATYFYVSSVVFLVGAQLDEFLRKEAKGHETVGVPEFARRVLQSVF